MSAAEWPLLDSTEPETIERYYKEAADKIKTGETVWVQRNFEAEGGRILDLFMGGRHKGFIIEGDDHHQEYESYARPVGNTDVGPVLVFCGDVGRVTLTAVAAHLEMVAAAE